jgi:hypothetical protein
MGDPQRTGQYKLTPQTLIAASILFLHPFNAAEGPA